MNDFLTSPVFRYAVFPLAGAVLGVGLKYVTRNDQYAKFQKEDLAVGLELILTACLMYVALVIDKAASLHAISAQIQVAGNPSLDATKLADLQARAQDLALELSTAGWTVALMFLGLWSVSTVVRKLGWESDTEMKPFIGIGFPLAVGIFFLVAVMAGASP